VSYKVYLSPSCKKQVKKLAKKFRSLPDDLSKLSSSLKINPIQGTPLGNNVYKIRFAVASKGKGKRGGMRVITYVKVINTSVFLVAIYDKSERGNITDVEIQNSLAEVA
jgi:mRNA-degrading endonuclease RelE of RelBE toxin-antitoxin system